MNYDYNQNYWNKQWYSYISSYYMVNARRGYNSMGFNGYGWW